MKRTLTTAFPLALALLYGGITAGAQEIITSPPAGGTTVMYERSGWTYYVDGVRKKTKEFADVLTETVEYSDGTVYLKNPVSQMATTSNDQAASQAYIKGTKTDDTMTFQLPQNLSTGKAWNNEDYTTECCMFTIIPGNYPNGRKAADQTLEFKKDSEGNWKMQGATDGTWGVGVYAWWDDPWGWSGYAEYAVVLKPVASGDVELPVSFPAGASTEKWAATANGTGYFVDVYVDGDDLYIGGLFSNMTSAVVKGTKSGNNYTFDAGQYIGLDGVGAKAYFMPAKYEVLYDESTDRNYRAYVPAESISFSYDAAAKKLTCTDTSLYMIVTDSKAPAEVRYPTATADVATIAWQPADVDKTPATPVLSDYSDYNATEKEGWIVFNLPATNTEGQLLDKSNIYWRVLVDNKVLEVKYENGHYYGANGTMTELPYDITISGISTSGARHSFSFYITDFKFIGVQALYKESADAQPVYSEILSANGAEIPGVWLGEEPEPEPEPETPTLITEVPAGGKLRIFKRSGQGFIESGIKRVKTEFEDVATEIYEYEDGTVYLKNPVNLISQDDYDAVCAKAYIKGKLVDGTKMVFNVPQPLADREAFNHNNLVTNCVIMACTQTGAQPQRLEDKSFSYEKQDDGTWKMVLPKPAGTGLVILGAWGAYDAPAGWTSYGEWDVTLTPEGSTTEVITSVPEGGTVHNFKRSGTAVYESGIKRLTEDFEDLDTELVMYEDGTVYFKNPVSRIGDDSQDSAAAQAYIKGSYTDTEMTFDLPQSLVFGTAFNKEAYSTDAVMVTLNLSGMISATKTDDQKLVFKKDDKGAWVMEENAEGTLAIAAWGRYDAPALWTNYADYNVVLTPEAEPEPEVPGVITSVPEGGKTSYFKRSGTATYEITVIKRGYEDFTDVTTELVTYPDGTVYFKNPITKIGTDDRDSQAAKGYIKGKIDGDKMTFQLPQPLYAGVAFNGNEYTTDCVLARVDITGSISAYKTEDQLLVFNKDADGNWVMENNTYGDLAIAGWGRYDAPMLWTNYADLNVVMAPDGDVPDVITTLPEGGELTVYDRSGTAVYESGIKRLTKEFSGVPAEIVRYADGTVYFKNPVSMIGEDSQDSAAAQAYIKGVYTEETMTFDLPQALVYGQAFNKDTYSTDCVMATVNLSGMITAEQTADQQLVFKKDAEGNWVLQGDAAIAAWGRYDAPALWTNYADLNVVLAPQAAPGIIREAPEGKKTVYSRSGSAWIDKTTRKEKIEFADVATEIVTTDNGEVYFRNPVSQMPTDSYIKGTYTDDTMTFSFPQPVDEGEMFNGDPYTSYAYLLDCDASKSETNPVCKPAAAQTLVYKKGADGTWKMQDMESGAVILGIVGSFLDADAWAGYGEWGVSLAEFGELPEPVVVPSTVKFDDWAAKYSLTGRFVEVGFDGSDVYLRGISTSIPDAAVKGEVKDGKAVFASPQYLGIDAAGNLQYFTAAEQKRGVDDENEKSYIYYVAQPALTFTYDAAKKSMATTQYAIVTDRPADTEILNPAEGYDSLVIAWQPADVDLTPAAPQLIEYVDLEKGKGEGAISFNLPAYNADGQLIDTADMYWQLLVDEEIYTINEEGKHYAGIKDLQDVPYDFDTKLEIFATGVRHLFLFYFSDYDFLGLRQLYKDGDKTYYSAITTVTGEMPDIWKVGVADVEGEGDLVSRVYFDLSGHEVKNPAKGIYIVVDTYESGRRVTSKVVK